MVDFGVIQTSLAKAEEDNVSGVRSPKFSTLVRISTLVSNCLVRVAAFAVAKFSLLTDSNAQGQGGGTLSPMDTYGDMDTRA